MRPKVLRNSAGNRISKTVKIMKVKFLRSDFIPEFVRDSR